MALALAASAADAVSARMMAGVLAIVCAMASATPAEAQVATSRHPDLLMSEGHELYDAGRYKEAAASFERAMQLGVERPHDAAWNVARSYARLGNRKQAARWVEIAELLGTPGGRASGEVVRALSVREALRRRPEPS